MFQRIKAVVTRSANTNRPEEAVGPEDWFDRQYHREIRRKHVSAAALFFMSGMVTPIAITFLVNGMSPEGVLFTAACVLPLLMAIPDVRKLISWQLFYRQRAQDTQADLMQLQAEYRTLRFNYCILSTCIERTAEGDAPSAEIIQLNSERRDH